MRSRSGEAPPWIVRFAGLASIVLSIGFSGCTDSRVRGPRVADAARVRLEVDSGAAYGILGALRDPKAPLSAGLRETLPAIAYCASSEIATVETAIHAETPVAEFQFHALREAGALARAEATLRIAIEALAIRRAAIERAASRYLPASTPPTRLRVRLCLGMPQGFVARSIVDGDSRGLLLDVGGLRTSLGAVNDDRLRDELGKAIERRIAPELFTTAYESLERTRGDAFPVADLDRFRRAMLVEGIADHIAKPLEDRFDDLARRRPAVDVAARAAIERFERNLERALDPRTPEAERDALRFSFANDAPSADARWGVVVASAMIDAIERFAPHGRVRNLVAAGPASLGRAYAEVCSGHAAIPRLRTETIAQLSNP